jgi:splicing factor 3B subunit 1
MAERSEKMDEPSGDPFEERRTKTIADRERGTYQERRQKLQLSPGVRYDPFADGSQTPELHSVRRTTAAVIRETQILNEKKELEMKLREKAKAGELKVIDSSDDSAPKKKRRWDQAAPGAVANDQNDQISAHLAAKDMETPMNRQIWDATPAAGESGAQTPPDLSSFSETPRVNKAGTANRRRWDETPKTERDTFGSETPAISGWAETPKVERNADVDSSHTIQKQAVMNEAASRKRSRWDETPLVTASSVTQTAGQMTPSYTPSSSGMMTPTYAGGMTSMNTPAGMNAMNLQTPVMTSFVPMTPEQMQAQRWEKEIDERNRPLSDEELDEMMPAGYKILPPPDGYVPIRTPARKLTATPTPMHGLGAAGGFRMMDTPNRSGTASQLLPDLQPASGNLPLMKPDDLQYFNKLLEDIDEESLPPEELKERTIMKLLLKIKNGTPPMRKAALRQITDKAREFGAGPLFNQILPLLMSPSLEDQERHLIVKVIDRILYKLDDLVRPYVHKILVVIEPLLIDEDYYARVEGREIISNLAKAAGLATMISTMRPDIDNLDEYVRNTTARAFAVVASALGIPSLLPFLKAVCKSKKSWQARHTGIKIIQQIAILMGCAILPHLKSLVEVIEHGLEDEQQKVRTITALGIAALAEAATPYGIESFDSVLKPLWKGKK